MVGMDVANSLAPAAQEIDMAAFERAVRNAFEGKKPLIDENTARETNQQLMQRLTSRNGQQPGATQPLPNVSKENVGLLIGADVGRSLAPRPAWKPPRRRARRRTRRRAPPSSRRTRSRRAFSPPSPACNT